MYNDFTPILMNNAFNCYYIDVYLSDHFVILLVILE